MYSQHKNMRKIIYNTNIMCPLGLRKREEREGGRRGPGILREREKNIKPPDLIYVFGIITL